MSETNCYARLSHSEIFAEAKSEKQPSRRMLCLGTRSVVRQIIENLLFSLAVVISKISQPLARSQWLCFTDSQCRTIDMLNADKAYISVPVTSLRTSNQCVPYVSSPMPSKVEAALLKNELQKAQVSCNKLPTHKIPYTHYNTQ